MARDQSALEAGTSRGNKTRREDRAKHPYYKRLRVPPIVDSRVPKIHAFPRPRHNSPSVRSRETPLVEWRPVGGERKGGGRGREKKRSEKKETSYPANSKRSLTTRRRTGRTNTAATAAAYQAAQVESGIWLSESSRLSGQSEWSGRGGEKGTAPNTLACMLARSRVFLIHHGRNACAFRLVFAPSPETPRDFRVPLPLPSPPAPRPLYPLAPRTAHRAVIMCSHIGVPAVPRTAGRGWRGGRVGRWTRGG